MANRISVIIPTSGRRKDITRTIDAVSQAPGVTADEIIVVVDAKEGAPLCDGVARWLWTGEQKGPACARNLGAASAKGEVLVFLDDDVHPDGVPAASAVVHFDSETVLAVEIRFRFVCDGFVDIRSFKTGEAVFRFQTDPPIQIVAIRVLNKKIKRIFAAVLVHFHSDGVVRIKCRRIVVMRIDIDIHPDDVGPPVLVAHLHNK